MVAAHVRSRTRRRTVTWVIWGLVALLVLSVGWVLVRALIARDQLIGALPVAQSVRDAILDGQTDTISAQILDLQERADTAASLTSDPVWRVFEVTPVVGANLTAFRQAAELVHQVSDNGLPPLGELASTLTIQSFSPTDGQFDLAPFHTAAPLIAEASAALVEASRAADSIDTSGTISQVGEAVDQLVDLVDETRSLVGSLDTAVTLVPSMLGADGPRNYLLMSLNNSELRATGGLPGALAIISADDGRVTLGETAAANTFGELPSPILPLSDAETQLYGEILGTYMLDVNMTPDFARTAALAQAMWANRNGQVIDGVVALDPVALGYILRATGPIEAGNGITISADNAVSVLLSEVYALFAEPKRQDEFFVGVTKQVFAALTGGSFDKQALIGALSKAADERRVHLWSAHADEQELLSESSLAGALPNSTSETSAFGVYLNDGTGAKMDYYLRAGIDVASGLCGPNAQPNFGVQVRLQSTAPADAAVQLPRYVTGGGAFGVEPGNVATNVYLYAPAGTRPYEVTIDGVSHGFLTAQHDGRTVIAVRVELVPGQVMLLDFRVLGDSGTPSAVSLEHTPLASEVPVSLDNFLDCPVPPVEEVSQS